MSIRDTIANFLGVTSGDRNNNLFTVADFGIGGALSGESVTIESAMQNSVVLSAVNLIADGVAQLPWNVIDSQGTVLTQNNIDGIIRRPNVYQSPFEFKKSLVSSLMLYGNAYINVIRVGEPGNVRPRQLVLLHPEDITVETNAAGLPLYKVDGRDEPFTHIDIIHIKDINDFTVTGKSRVRLASDSIGLYKATTRFAGNMFKTGPQVGGVLTFPGSVDEQKRKNLKEGFDAFSTKGQDAARVLVLEDGASFNSFNKFTAADADLRAFRLMLIDEVAGAFRVPAFAIGGGGDEKYNNVGQKYASMYRDTFAPLITSIEEPMTGNLLQGDRRLSFDVSILTKGDRTTQIDNAVKLKAAGIWTANEARAELGLAAIEGGDELSTSATPEEAPGDQSTGGNGDDS